MMNHNRKLHANDFFHKLKKASKEAFFTDKIAETIRSFYLSYEKVALKNGFTPSDFVPTFFDYVDYVSDYLKNPFEFEPYHKQVRTPCDYFQFGLNFLRPLVDMENSKIHGQVHFEKMKSYLHQGDNIILLANHQIEADPIAIALMLLKNSPKLAQELISVAGERVVTDPLSVPFSMGCNLLCIYSKRYIDHPIEEKAHKQHHNKKTMKLLSELLSLGGHCIYIAPSGGRDRKNEKGQILPAPFDPKSVEMLYLMAKKAKKKTHFFPLALSTYTILPPPEAIQQELGEERITEGGSIQLSFGQEINMDNILPPKIKDKYLQRELRANYIHNLVVKDYLSIA